MIRTRTDGYRVNLIDYDSGQHVADVVIVATKSEEGRHAPTEYSIDVQPMGEYVVKEAFAFEAVEHGGTRVLGQRGESCAFEDTLFSCTTIEVKR